MTRSSPPQVAFSAGEIDPLLRRRFDYARFQTGLAVCHGFLPLPQGAITRAPGSTVMGRTRLDQPAILLPFQFAANDAVVLEITAGWMRVWRYGQLVMTGGGSTPYELPLPYDALDLQNLRWVQSADVIYLVDGRHPVQRLARLALDNWTIGPVVFSTGPFRVQNVDSAIKLTPSARTGTITLTATGGDVFLSGHVGTLFRLQAVDNATVLPWQAGQAISAGDLRRYDSAFFRFVSGANTGQEPPIHDEGVQLYAGSIAWEYVADSAGVVRILSVEGPRTATAQVLRTLPPPILTNPTYRWSEGAWSSLHGYPSSIEIYDQRLCLAGTPAEPRTIWFSTVGDFADFTPSTEADGSFAYTIAGNSSQNRITGLKRGGSALHIFALSEEYSSVSDSRSTAIGPTTAVFRQDGSAGARFGKAIAPKGDPIFVSRDGRRLMMVRYQFDRDRNVEVHLSRASQHLGDAGLLEVIWQDTPEPRAWILRATGDLACMIYDEAEEILGWSTHSLGQQVSGGAIEALTVTQNSDGTQDEVYCVVSHRSTSEGGGSRVMRTLERLDFSHYLGAAVTFPNAVIPSPVEDILMPWLAGLPVTIEGAPAAQPSTTLRVTVTAAPGTGRIVLPEPMLAGVAGLFDPGHNAQTLDVQAAAPDGSSLGRLKRLHGPLSVGVHETQGGTVQVIEHHPPMQVASPRLPVPLIQPGAGRIVAPSFSGVVEVAAPSGTAREVSVIFRPEGNASLTITGVFPTVQEAGR